REFFDPAMHAVIVPSKRNQDPLLPLLHGSASIAVRRYLSTTLNFARTAHAPKPHAAADFSAGSFCPGRLPDRRFDPSKCMMIRSDTGRDCVGGVCSPMHSRRLRQTMRVHIFHLQMQKTGLFEARAYGSFFLP